MTIGADGRWYDGGMKYRQKPIVIEAITFAELVDHGVATAASLHEGVPWSFQYAGCPVTHETNDCYLIGTPDGTLRFNRGEMLVTREDGGIEVCKADIFAKTYERFVSG